MTNTFLGGGTFLTCPLLRTRMAAERTGKIAKSFVGVLDLDLL